MAGTRWFKVGWGPKGYSLHIHVKENGSIDNKEHKIRSDDFKQEIYVNNIPPPLYAKIKALNPFREKKK